jgi:hypothetical protein
MLAKMVVEFASPQGDSALSVWCGARGLGGLDRAYSFWFDNRHLAVWNSGRRDWPGNACEGVNTDNYIPSQIRQNKVEAKHAIY